MLRITIGALLAIALIGEVASRLLVAQDVKCVGTIMKIEGETITVQDRTEQQEMKIKPATKITQDGKPASSMDLKVGQQVACVCQWNENEMICTTLEIMKDGNGFLKSGS